MATLTVRTHAIANRIESHALHSTRLDDVFHYRICNKFSNSAAKIVASHLCDAALLESYVKNCWINSVMVAGFVNFQHCHHHNHRHLTGINDKAVSFLCVCCLRCRHRFAIFYSICRHQRVNVLVLLSEWIKSRIYQTKQVSSISISRTSSPIDLCVILNCRH